VIRPHLPLVFPCTARVLGAHLGLAPNTVVSWCTRWHGPGTPGVSRELSPVDVLVARAWQVIADSDEALSIGDRQTCAEIAIRTEPLRWLLLTESGASTHPTVEDATRVWESLIDAGDVGAQIIDLDPTGEVFTALETAA
jgi:hypothetical protein